MKVGDVISKDGISVKVTNVYWQANNECYEFETTDEVSETKSVGRRKKIQSVSN